MSTPTLDPLLRPRRRRFELTRSKKGCLTCRGRRKKCPEDYQQWPDGSFGCSTCSERGQKCVEPPPTTGPRRSNSHRTTFSRERESRSSSPNRTEQIDQRDEVNATPRRNRTSLPSDPDRENRQRTQSYSREAVVPSTIVPETEITKSSLSAAAPTSQSNINSGPWIDSFFNDFIQLTWPTLQQQPLSHSIAGPADLTVNGVFTTTTSSGPYAPSPFAEDRTGLRDFMPPSAVSLESPQYSESTPGSTSKLPWSYSNINKTVQSDDLDELLTRWSYLYETFLCALFDVSRPAGDTSIKERLMDVIQSRHECKASVIALCLAYRDLIVREMQQKGPMSSFTRYLMNGNARRDRDQEDKEGEVKESNGDDREVVDDDLDDNNTNSGKKGVDSSNSSDALYASQFALAWLKYAIKVYHESRAEMPITVKMLTLLHIRNASVCLLGAKASHSLADDIHDVLTEAQVDIGYLFQTNSSGTILALVVQALSLANFMDCATLCTKRPATKDHTISSLLVQDAVVNPHAEFRFVTTLSSNLIACMKRIYDLIVDVKEGKVERGRELEERASSIRDSIMTSQADFPIGLEESSLRVRAFGLHEMWRQAILIQLYQDVYGMGPMAKRIQHSLSQIIHLAQVTSMTEGGKEPLVDMWDMAMVWFLACTVAIKEEHRNLCLLNLKRISYEWVSRRREMNEFGILEPDIILPSLRRAVLDDVRAVKVLWKDMDETGRANDWRKVLSENDLAVSYTF